MEAVKPQTPLEFKYADVVVLVKPWASSEDRMEFIIAESRSARLRVAAGRMVVGWRGVIRDGEEVPYALEELSNVPDVEGAGNFMLRLAGFILDKTDLAKGLGATIKNGSAPSSTGASEQAPSTAGAKTA